MAVNETDPLATRLSGTDPQSLMEYITRQRIYDSRYWKEECFGLTTSHVLEKAAQLQSIGGLPNHFLSLLLKLLQLHPEHEIIQKAFCEQDDFKYVRALGALYIRLTSRPVDIYTTLEPLLQDGRLLRVWTTPRWTIQHMDEYIYALLSQKTTHCLTIALPRLPARRFLVEAGYLEEEVVPTALQKEIADHAGALEYLRYLALVEKHPSAIAAWTKRGEALPIDTPTASAAAPNSLDDLSNEQEGGNAPAALPEDDVPFIEKSTKSKTTQKAKKKQRNYNNLFKASKTKKAKQQQDDLKVGALIQPPAVIIEGSEEYWNDQRAKLGLGQLK